jgi:hypothetical protein
MIVRDIFRDDMKAPLNNKAKPASVSAASTNVYFGTNTAIDKARGLIKRTAYAVGSGVRSIGLDQTTMKLNCIFPQMVDLMNMAYNAVMLDDRFKDTMKDKYFNFCSVKIYYSFKNARGKTEKKYTGWHTDVTYDKDGNPMSDNSQVPGTPVVIATFGDTKELEFKSHNGVSGKDDDNSNLIIEQRHGSIFVLHPDDEMIDPFNGCFWKHKSAMKAPKKKNEKRDNKRTNQRRRFQM